MKFSPKAPEERFGSRSALAPVRVMLGRINVNSLVDTAVHREIGLPIAVEIKPRHATSPSTGLFQIEVRTVLPCHGTRAEVRR